MFDRVAGILCVGSKCLGSTLFDLEASVKKLGPRAVSLLCSLSLMLALFGCNGKELDDPLMRSWDARVDSIGTQYEVGLRQKVGVFNASNGEVDDAEVIDVNCIRQDGFYAIKVLEPNGDEYIHLRNPKYCSLISRPKNSSSYKIDQLAAAVTEDYNKDTFSMRKLDPITSLLTGDFLIDFYRISGTSNQSTRADDRVQKYKIGIDTDSLERMNAANLDIRIVPRDFQIEVASESDSNMNSRWLSAWDYKPVSIVEGEVLPLSRRRVTVKDWTKFPDLDFEIPSNFDSWADESGKMNWYRNREATPKLLKLEKWSPTEQTCSVGKFQVLDNGKQPLGRPP